MSIEKTAKSGPYIKTRWNEWFFTFPRFALNINSFLLFRIFLFCLDTFALHKKIHKKNLDFSSLFI